MSITHYPELVYVENNVIGTPNSAVYDAFGRLRVSSPFTIFDAKNVMSQNSLFDDDTTGSATVNYVSNKSSVELNCTEASGDKVIHQSYRVMPYQPGKSLLNFNTFVMNAQTENLRQAVGYFNDQNGYFFEDSGTAYQLVRRTYATGSAVDTEIPQSSWNGDKLDGTGPSGYTLDPTKSNILYMDMEWLGVGAVRMGFVIDGKVIVAHTFYNANALETVHMSTPNLPVRYEIEVLSTLATGTYTLQQICSSVISEGGYAPTGDERVIGTASLSGVNLASAGTFYNLATIRIKAGRPYAVIIPSGIDVLNISNQLYEWTLLKNATPGTAFSYTSFDDNVEYDRSTVTITGGTRVAGGYIGQKSSPASLLSAGLSFSNQIGQSITGVSDTLTLAVKCASPSSNGAGLLKWFDLT